MEIPKRVVHERPILFRPNMTAITSNIVVCAYARVSTEDEEQEESYKRQIEHFTVLIKSHSNWQFGGVYADHGITGTQAELRPQFNKMIEECRAGHINKILVKSVSRFARNTEESLHYIKEMKRIGVSIFFENENVDTLTPGGEILITIMSAMAEQESRNMSSNIKWAFQKKFQKGEVLINYKHSLGYDKVDGKYVIVEEQAEVIRRIFSEFIDGKPLNVIAKGLMADEIKTGTGKTKWSASGVERILQNEKYTGNAIMGKTYKNDVLDKKRLKNNGTAPSYYIEHSHPAIISQEIFDMAQASLKERTELRSHTETGKGKYSAKYPLSGLIVCAKCGNKFRRHIRTHENGFKHPMWVCMGHDIGNHVCEITPIREERIINAYRRAAERLIGDLDEVIETVKRNAEELLSTNNENELIQCEMALAESQDKMIKLYRDYREGSIAETDYRMQYEIIKNEIESCQAAKDKIMDENNKLLLLQHRKDEIFKVLNSDEVQIFNDDNIKKLVEKIVVKDSKLIEIEFKCGITVTEELSR